MREISKDEIPEYYRLRMTRLMTQMRPLADKIMAIAEEVNPEDQSPVVCAFSQKVRILIAKRRPDPAKTDNEERGRKS